MQGLILAAGRGTRLRPHTDTIPKPLITVAGERMLDRSLNALAEAGVTTAVIVVGYRAEQILQSYPDRHRQVRIEYVHNTDYETTGTAYSFHLGLQAIDPDQSLLVLEGDVVFDSVLLDKLLEACWPNATLVEDYRPDLQGSFIDTCQDDFVTSWLHTDMRSPGQPVERMKKTVNISRLSPALVRDIQSHACNGRWHPLHSIESVMHDRVTSGDQRILAVPTGGLRWYEVDNAADLAQAEDLFGDR